MEKDYLLLIDGSSLLTTQFYGNLPREVMFAKTLEEKKKAGENLLYDYEFTIGR